MKSRNGRSRSRVIGRTAALMVATIWLSPVGAPDAAAQSCRSLLQLERRHPKFSVKRMLRRGRYVIAIRHGDKGARGDGVPEIPGCPQPGQSLTNRGKEQAGQIGAGLGGPGLGLGARLWPPVGVPGDTPLYSSVLIGSGVRVYPKRILGAETEAG